MSETEQTRAVVRAYLDHMVARNWEAFAATLADDVEYEIPQSRERISGRENYVRFNAEYPGDWVLKVTRLLVDGNTAAATFNFQVGGEYMVGIGFLELTNGLISRVTDFWPEPYEPPTGREHLVQRVDGRTDHFAHPATASEE
ncbi:nuclear transport factor 2 family protein [Kribbella deserti]|uniref:Nuclear transport factor 2 family protein n=1 Tax=Kribbella deserti TaxID=1926257 RepID=A0ABV6QTX1_9ACTN